MKFYPVDRFFSDAFDDMFDRPFFSTNSNVMKTDVSEKDGMYLLNMELPGVKKEDIKLDLENGYLTIGASRNTSNEDKDAKGNIIRQERYSGTFSRSFYVGDKVTENDIKASFDNGELKITFPKEIKVIPEKKQITID